METTGRYQRTIELYEYYKNGKLILKPFYQRNSVWDENMRSYLIDTIVSGYTMPPVFIRTVLDEETLQVKYEVLDGQQRLTSIFSYISNELTMKKSHNELYGTVLFSQLPTEIKNIILNFEISVVDVSSATDEEIFELFARLNSNNMKLNHQEVRHSKFHGEFKVYIQKQAKIWSSDIFDDFKIFNKKNKSRMLDQEFIVQLALLCDQGIVEGSQTNLSKLYEKYEDLYPFDMDTKLECIRKLFSNHEYYKLVQSDKLFKNKTFMYLIASHYLSKEIDIIDYLEFLKWFNVYNLKFTNKLINSEELTELHALLKMRTTNKSSREKRLAQIDGIYKYLYTKE